MEFPDDILRLIRDFARPKMKFVNEYRGVMRKLEMDEWDAVKKRLFDPDAEQVIVALIAYADSFIHLVVELERIALLSKDSKEYLTIQNEVPDYRLKTIALHRSLRVLLVGEKKVLHYEKWLNYEVDHAYYDNDQVYESDYDLEYYNSMN